MKKCSRCNVQKTFNEFNKNKSRKDGFDHRCRDCKKLDKKELRSNPSFRQAETEYKKRHYQENSEMILSKQNSPEMKAYFKEYRRKNREYFYRKYREYILARNALPGEYNDELKEEIIELYNYECCLSGEKDDLSLDHFIPVKTSQGSNTKENVILLTRSINISKGSHNPFEWINTQEAGIKERFENVVVGLAQYNQMSIEEYREYVYSCFENSILNS